MPTPVKPAYTYLLAASQTLKTHPLATLKILAVEAGITLLAFAAYRYLDPLLHLVFKNCESIGFWGWFFIALGRLFLTFPIRLFPFILCSTLYTDGHARLTRGLILLLRNYGRMLIACIPLFLIYIGYIASPDLFLYWRNFLPFHLLPLVQFGFNTVIFLAFLFLVQH